MAEHPYLKRPIAHKKLVFSLIGMALVILFGAGQSQSKESSSPGSEKPECPENIDHLNHCAVMIYLSENPSIYESDELGAQLNRLFGSMPPPRELSCPNTLEQLGNCYAKQRVDMLKQILNRSPLPPPTSPDSDVKKPPQRLESFSKAENRWFERFKDEPIPTGAYQAYYFDSTNTEGFIYTETVPKVAINYHWSQGGGFIIDSNNFGGFWVGNIVVNEAGVFELSTAQPNSQSRVIINGYEISINDKPHIALEAGTYQVEVEFLNNWHTTDFAMNIEKVTQTFSISDTRHEFSQLSEDFDVWYVGIYESERNDRNATVVLQKSTRPVVLVLGSYSQVNWIINNQVGANILYILYSSYENGTSVTVDNFSGKFLKMKPDSLPYVYSIDVTCGDIRDAHFHCENIDGLRTIDASMQNIIARTPDGFSGRYSVDTISVPNQILNDESRATIYKSYDDVLKSRRDFQESQKIENIFN